MITKSFAVKRIILTVLVGVSMLLLPFRRRNQIYPISYQIVLARTVHEFLEKRNGSRKRNSDSNSWKELVKDGDYR